jgi:hypothetical protein
LPQAFRQEVLDELEYEADDSPRGLVLALDDDSIPDFIVQSSRSLCGSGGCMYSMIDGKSGRTIGRLLAQSLYLLAEEQRGHPVVGGYGSLGATTSTYAWWTFDGREYRRSGSQSYDNTSHDSLVAALCRIPACPKPAHKTLRASRPSG